MALAKRQKTEKPTKIEQSKVQGLEGEPLVKQTALLASPVYKGQAQRRGDKCIKRGAKIEPLSSMGSARHHTSRMYFPLLAK